MLAVLPFVFGCAIVFDSVMTLQNAIDLRRLGFSRWWLILLLALVLVTARAFYRIDKQAGWLLVPYLAWLIYAAYLNAGVWFLNK